jgi:DNA modification methylase
MTQTDFDPKPAKYEPRKISELQNWEDNPREISEEEFVRLQEHIRRLGVYKPLLINQNNVVLGGNMRLRALKDLGIEEAMCSIVLTDNTQQMIEYALSDNDQMGTTDEDKLAELVTLNPIKQELYAVSIGKLKPVETVLRQYGPEAEEDEPPAVEEIAISKLGEIYQVGRHRVMCGDSTSFGQVSDLMNGKEASLVFTDPPYGIAMSRSLVSGKDNSILGDDLPEEQIRDLLNESFSNALAVAPGASQYWWTGFRAYSMMEDIFKQNNTELSNCIVWVKPSIGLGKNGYRYRHELCLFTGRIDSASDSDVWEFGRDNAGLHPTMKPITLCSKAIKNSSNKDTIVLDLFLGSGSTLIACEQTDRICYGMELDPKYVDVIRKRYAKFTNNNELPDNWAERTPSI